VASLALASLSGLQPRLSVLFEQVYLVLRVPFGRFEETVKQAISVLAIRLHKFVTDVVERVQPVVMDASARVMETVDRAVIAAGDAMMEWVKKEHELRESISRKTHEL
jgi:hypothetical protein